jgi:hypothetical protein
MSEQGNNALPGVQKSKRESGIRKHHTEQTTLDHAALQERESRIRRLYIHV